MVITFLILEGKNSNILHIYSAFIDRSDFMTEQNIWLFKMLYNLGFISKREDGCINLISLLRNYYFLN